LSAVIFQGASHSRAYSVLFELSGDAFFELGFARDFAAVVVEAQCVHGLPALIGA
jgi:hypothetical protein